MKKIGLIIWLLMTIGTASNAQWSFGVKGGLNMSNVIVKTDPSSDWGDTFKNRTSFHVGGLVNYEINSRFSVQGEVLYSVKGFNEDEDNIDVKANFSYISMPVLLIYKPLSKLSVEVGPEIGYMASSYIKIEHQPAYDNPDWINKFDFAIDLGVRYNIISQLGVGLRYSYGLVDMYSLPDYFFKSVNYYNRTFQISLDYKFNSSVNKP